MAKMKTIESKVADAILQKKNQTITLGGKEYTFGKPSVATIILVSELVSELPEINTDIKQSELVAEVLRTAKDCKVIGRIVATIILGAKRINELKPPKKRFPWLQRACNELDELSHIVLQEMTAQEIAKIISESLVELEIGSFFGLTASLTQANVLKRTKSEDEAEETMTQSGQ